MTEAPRKKEELFKLDMTFEEAVKLLPLHIVGLKKDKKNVIIAELGDPKKDVKKED